MQTKAKAKPKQLFVTRKVCFVKTYATDGTLLDVEDCPDTPEMAQHLCDCYGDDNNPMGVRSIKESYQTFWECEVRVPVENELPPLEEDE